MPGSWLAVFGVCLTIAILPRATAGQSQSSPSYIDIVKRYRAGEFEGAVSDLQGMRGDHVKTGAQALLPSIGVARGIEMMRAAAMPACEAGILERTNGTAQRPEDWDRAAAFMALVEAADPHDPLVRTWRLLNPIEVKLIRTSGKITARRGYFAQ